MDSTPFEQALAARHAEQFDDKVVIARRVIAELPDDGVVVLDSGSLTFVCAQAMPTGPVTGRGDQQSAGRAVPGRLENLRVLHTARYDPRPDLGGRRRPGPAGGSRTLTADLAIIGVNGTDASHGLTTTNPEEAATKRAMLLAARRRIVPVISGKLGRNSFCSVRGGERGRPGDHRRRGQPRDWSASSPRPAPRWSSPRRRQLIEGREPDRWAIHRARSRSPSATRALLHPAVNVDRMDRWRATKDPIGHGRTGTGRAVRAGSTGGGAVGRPAVVRVGHAAAIATDRRPADQAHAGHQGFRRELQAAGPRSATAKRQREQGHPSAGPRGHRGFSGGPRGRWVAFIEATSCNRVDNPRAGRRFHPAPTPTFRRVATVRSITGSSGRDGRRADEAFASLGPQRPQRPAASSRRRPSRSGLPQWLGSEPARPEPARPEPALSRQL